MTQDEKIAALEARLAAAEYRLAKIEAVESSGVVWDADIGARLLNAEIAFSALIENGINAGISKGELAGIHDFLRLYQAGFVHAVGQQPDPNVVKALSYYHERGLAIIQGMLQSASFGPTAGNA